MLFGHAFFNLVFDLIKLVVLQQQFQCPANNQLHSNKHASWAILNLLTASTFQTFFKPFGHVGDPSLLFFILFVSKIMWWTEVQTSDKTLFPRLHKCDLWKLLSPWAGGGCPSMFWCYKRMLPLWNENKETSSLHILVALALSLLWLSASINCDPLDQLIPLSSDSKGDLIIIVQGKRWTLLVEDVTQGQPYSTTVHTTS